MLHTIWMRLSCILQGVSAFLAIHAWRHYVLDEESNIYASMYLHHAWHSIHCQPMPYRSLRLLVSNIHAFYKAHRLIQCLYTLLYIPPPLHHIILVCPIHIDLHIYNHPDHLVAFHSQDHPAELIQFVLQKWDHLHPKLQGYSIEQNDNLGCNLYSPLKSVYGGQSKYIALYAVLIICRRWHTYIYILPRW